MEDTKMSISNILFQRHNYVCGHYEQLILTKNVLNIKMRTPDQGKSELAQG